MFAPIVSLITGVILFIAGSVLAVYLAAVVILCAVGGVVFVQGARGLSRHYRRASWTPMRNPAELMLYAVIGLAALVLCVRVFRWLP